MLGVPSQIEALSTLGYNLQDCIDVSLKAYLSSLYLKSDNFDVYLGLGRSTPSKIMAQAFL